MRRVLSTLTCPIRVSSDVFVGLCYDAYRANKNICTTVDDLMKKRFPNAIFNCNSKEYSVIIKNPFFDWQRKPGNFELVHYGMSSIAIIEVWSYHLLLC